MNPGDYDITIYQGQTFVRELEITDSTMQGINLSGFEAKMQIRDAKNVNSPLVATLHSDLNQILSSTGATGGTFTLKFGLYTTSPIAYNATALDVKNALEALPNIGFNAIYTSGGPLPREKIVISFVGPFLHKNQPLLVTDDTHLIGDPINVIHQVVGVAPQNASQQISIIGAIGGTFTLTYMGQTTTPIAYNASNTTIKNAIEAMTNIGTGNISVSGGALPVSPITITFVNALGQSPQPSFTVDDALLVGGVVSSVMTIAGVTPQNAKQTISNTGATAGTFRLRFKGQDSTTIAYNATKDDVVAALEGANSIHAGNVIATGGPLPGTPVVIEFVNALKWTPQPLVDGVSIAFTGGPITAAQPTPGVLPRNTIYSLHGGGAGSSVFNFAVGSPVGQTATSLSGTITAASLLTALQGLTNIGVGNVNTSGGPLGTNPILITFQGTLANIPITVTITGGTGGAGGTVVADTTSSGAQTGLVGTNAVQTLSLANADGGSFTLSFTNPATGLVGKTGTLPWNASAYQIQTALHNVPGIAFTSFSPTGFPQTPNVLVTDNGITGANISNSLITLTFQGTLQKKPISQTTATDQNFTKGTVAVSSTQTGVSPISAVQTLTRGLTRRGTFTLTFNGNTSNPIPYNATVDDIKKAFTQMLVSLDNVSISGGPFGTAVGELSYPIVVNFVNGLQSQPVSLITANNTYMVGGPVIIADMSEGVIGVNERQVLTEGSVTDGTFTISFNGNETVPLNYNANAVEIQAALATLVSIGTGNVLVNAVESDEIGAAIISNGTLDEHPMRVEFTLARGKSPQPSLSVDSSSLTNQTAIVVQPPNDGIILIDPVNSTLTLKMFADKTSTFSGWDGNKYYDLKLIAPNGDVERLFQGKVFLDEQVTSDEPFAGTPQPQFLPRFRTLPVLQTSRR